MSAHAPVLTTNAPSAFSAGKAAGKPTLRHGAPLFSAPALCRGMVLVVASSGKKYRWCGSGRPPGDDSPGAGALRLKNEKAAEHSAALIFNWCPGGDSNSHAIRRYHLKIVCLPIPPPGHELQLIENRPGWQAFFFRFTKKIIFSSNNAHSAGQTAGFAPCPRSALSFFAVIFVLMSLPVMDKRLSSR